MPNDSPDWSTSVTAPQKQLGTFQAPPNGTTARTFNIDSGVHSIGILLNSFANVNGVTVTGGVTGIAYAVNLSQSAAFGTLLFVPVLSIWDTSVTVGVIMGVGAQTATVFVAQILDPELVAVFQTAPLQVQATILNQPITADVTDRAGRLLGIVNIKDSVAGQILADNSNLRATLAFANPAPWQAATSMNSINASLSNAQNSVIVAAVANQTVYLHWLFLRCSITPAQGLQVALQDTNNNEMARSVFQSTTQDIVWNGGMGGNKQPAFGAGVRIANITGGGGAVAFGGYVAYSQQ